MTLLASPAGIGLVADIGGTHARFALSTATHEIRDALVLDADQYESIEAAAEAYLARIGRPAMLQAAVLACAGPIEAGTVRFSNSHWHTSEPGFGARLRIPAVRLINDLAAVAWAVPLMKPEDLRQVGGPALGAPEGTIAIVGVGTGFNAAAFLPGETAETVIGGEYGHTGFAPTDAEDVEIWRMIGGRFGRVSIERVLSGPGLLNVYQAICAMAGAQAVAMTPAEVSEAARAQDQLAIRAVNRFCAILGTVAGDVALAYGAAGGVLVAGGIAPTMLTELDGSHFRTRFEAKGRLADHQKAIPTAVIVNPTPALLGSARAMTVLHRPRAHPARAPS